MKLYVNFAFLENLLLAEEQTDRHFYIKKLLSSPQPGVELVIDIDAEEAYQDPDKRTIFRQIAQRLPITDTTFLLACQTKQFHESGESKLFFVDDVPLLIERQFGCFFVSTSTLEKADLLFYAEPFRINRSQRDWSVLRNVKHPCNALILTDNYLFANDTAHENIVSILAALMPDELTGAIDFHLTIIGYSAKDFKSIQKQADEVLTLLKPKFTYPIRLTIIRADHHGRYIHTNYFRVFSEKGFGLFKNKRISDSNETSLDCQPLTLSGRYAAVLSTRNEELQKCVAINRTERMPDKIAGNRVNRLLQ